MLCWNVYRENINTRHIEIWNVFEHGRFREEVLEAFSQTNDKEYFSELVASVTRYYFWAKCEYEVIITGWPYKITDNKLHEPVAKIDIYNQLGLNWGAFIDYIWDNAEGEF